MVDVDPLNHLRQYGLTQDEASMLREGFEVLLQKRDIASEDEFEAFMAFDLRRIDTRYTADTIWMPNETARGIERALLIGCEIKLARYRREDTRTYWAYSRVYNAAIARLVELELIDEPKPKHNGSLKPSS